MFQMWGKLVENNHILSDLTVCIDDEDTRTHKSSVRSMKFAMPGIGEADSLDTNISEFKRDRKRGSHKIILSNRAGV